MPGGVDAHVHLCQDLKTGPHGLGGECADNFETGSRSAAAGGTTTMITFATQTRDESDRSLIKVVEAYNARAEATGSYIDYGFHIIIVRNDEDVLKVELPALVKDWGITSCKLFMTYESQRLTDSQLLDVMLASQKNDITTMIHAENGDMIQWLTEKLEDKGMVAPYYHALSRPPIVEMEATNRAIALAGLIQNPVLFVHIGSAIAATNVRNAQTQGMPIYAETCPQYLNLTYDDLQRFHSPTCFENSKHVCSPPPPPGTSDQDELYLGLLNGTFTIFSSDHCPFRYDSPHGKLTGVLEDPSSMKDEAPCEGEALQDLVKRKPGSFRFIPNGIPGVETRLPLLFSGGLATGRITAQKFVELTSTNPAKLYGLYPKKGALMVRFPGNLCICLTDAYLFSLDQMPIWSSLINSMLHHNVDYTPYEGKEFVNWPRYTILRGKVIWAEGELTGKAYDGEYLKRGPSYFGKGASKRPIDSRKTATWLH
ncbi:D-hydantoinase [Aureobasidium subglaciale]|nr:D-hydantoinase [Aureobasidium subglaciale]KAI5226550.1 D-hydantoinase [Aureobasidium subglaciale]KAI5229887.1 D-hydantoinase [Aureobasidium subglaciale]KAI5264344.1 D-hydantoinase [Aureobasidium subglaciale]